MEEAASNLDRLVDWPGHIARRLFIIGENRLELLLAEAQEERTRLFQAVLLLLGAAGFGFLSLLALNTAIVVLLWNYSPVAALLALTGFHALGALWLYLRLARLLRDWRMLSSTLDQLRKDRECLEKSLM